MKTTETAFSLIEVVIACTLSFFLLTSLGVFLQISPHTAQEIYQQYLLQQRLWLVKNLLQHLIQSAGYSALYPASPGDWQALTHHPDLRLYQEGQEALPSELEAHWRTKLLAHSSILEIQYLETHQFVQAQQEHGVELASTVSAKIGSTWLLVAPNAWQQASIDQVSQQKNQTRLHFKTSLDKAFQPPYWAGLKQHQLWFVAQNGQRNPHGQNVYGLYQWSLDGKSSPQEIVEGITQWQGDLISTDYNPTVRLLRWQFSLSETRFSRHQDVYLVNYPCLKFD